VAFFDAVEDVAQVVETSSKRVSCKERIVPFTLHYMWSASEEEHKSAGSAYWQFSAGIKPEEGEQAEIELTRNIAKEGFLAMKVVGQFNCGFIAARLSGDLGQNMVVLQPAQGICLNLLRAQSQPAPCTALSQLVLRQSGSGGAALHAGGGQQPQGRITTTTRARCGHLECTRCWPHKPAGPV